MNIYISSKVQESISIISRLIKQGSNIPIVQSDSNFPTSHPIFISPSSLSLFSNLSLKGRTYVIIRDSYEPKWFHRFVVESFYLNSSGLIQFPTRYSEIDSAIRNMNIIIRDKLKTHKSL